MARELHDQVWREEHAAALASAHGPRACQLCAAHGRDHVVGGEDGARIAPFAVMIVGGMIAPMIIARHWHTSGKPDAPSIWIAAYAIVALLGIVTWLVGRQTRRVVDSEVTDKTVRLRAAVPLPPPLAAPFPSRLVRFDRGLYFVRPSVHALLVPGVRYRLRCTWGIFAAIELPDGACPLTPYR